MLEEVRLVGSQKKGTAIAGCMISDVVVLFKSIPVGKTVLLRDIVNMSSQCVCVDKIVRELAYKVKNVLEGSAGDEKVNVEVELRGKCKEERERRGSGCTCYILMIFIVVVTHKCILR